MNERKLVARCREVDEAYQRARALLGLAEDPRPAQMLAEALRIPGRTKRIARLSSLGLEVWGMYLDAFYPACFRSLKSRLRGPFGDDVAEEAAHQALVKYYYYFAVNHPGRFDGSRNQRPWVAKVAWNEAISLVRPQTRQREREVSRDVEGAPEEWDQSSDDSPEDEAIDGLDESTRLRREMEEFVQQRRGDRWARWFCQFLDDPRAASVMHNAVKECLAEAPAVAVNLAASELDGWCARFPAPDSAKGVIINVLGFAPPDAIVRDVITSRYLTASPSKEAAAELRRVERASEVAFSRLLEMVRQRFDGLRPPEPPVPGRQRAKAKARNLACEKRR